MAQLGGKGKFSQEEKYQISLLLSRKDKGAATGAAQALGVVHVVP